jgi:FlaG/FlaF family flagellin (archaellin)
MHKVCGMFAVILAVVFATVTLGAMPAVAAPKSDEQKRIERENETKRQADRQKEIDKTNRELDRNRQWRQQHGNDANINQNKLNDRTRDLNAQKQQLERQQREGKEKYLGGQKNSTTGRQGGGQNVAQENQRDAGRYGTFGRQGQGQYQGQQKRDW